MDAYLTRQEEIDLERQSRLEAQQRAAAVTGVSVNSSLRSNASTGSAHHQPFSQRFSQLWATRLQTPQGGWTVNTPRDPIHRRINKELRRLREASYECFKLNLQAWPASDAPTDFKYGMSAIKFFHFAEGGTVIQTRESGCEGYGVAPHVVPVMLVEGCYSNNSHEQDDEEMHLKVRFNGRWRSFENFLHYLCDRSVVPVPNPLDVQYQWWSSNGKSFNILGLPAEIRERIYYFALQPRISPAALSPWRSLRNDEEEADSPLTVKPHRYSRWPSRGRVPISTAPSVRLLRTSRQISREAAHVLYRSARFEFDSPRQLEEFFCSVGGNFENIRHIALRFGPKDLLKFFGAGLTLERRWEPSFAAFHLMYLANTLLSLEIELPRPGLLIEHEFLWDEDAQKGCIRKVEEWILHFARPFVRSLPVDLTGAVDPEVKRVFLEGLRAERLAAGSASSSSSLNIAEAEKADEQGGVPLDLDSGYDTGCDDQEYFALPVAKECASPPVDREEKRVYVAEQLPPRCTCSTPCVIDDF